MNGADGERKNKRDVGKVVVGGEAEGEVACSQKQRGQRGEKLQDSRSNVPGAESAPRECSRISPGFCLSSCVPVCLSRLLSSFSFGLAAAASPSAAAAAAAAAAATAAMWLSLQ